MFCWVKSKENKKPEIAIVVAMGKNRGIGAKNQLMWRLKDDLKLFKELTTGFPIIMGRKTYESIGKPLPNRRNIVISRSLKSVDGIEVAHSIEQAINLVAAEEKASIIGGGQIYQAALEYATHLLISFVDGEFDEADTFFPEVDFSEWREESRLHFDADERNEFAFDFVKFGRVLGAGLLGTGIGNIGTTNKC